MLLTTGIATYVSVGLMAYEGKNRCGKFTGAIKQEVAGGMLTG